MLILIIKPNTSNTNFFKLKTKSDILEENGNVNNSFVRVGVTEKYICIEKLYVTTDNNKLLWSKTPTMVVVISLDRHIIGWNLCVT